MKTEKINHKTATKASKDQPFKSSPNAISLPAVPFFQRNPIVQAKPADVIQKHPADDANKKMAEKPSAASLAAVKKYKKKSKTTKAGVWELVLGRVKQKEDFWNGVRDHVMLGESTTPPGGFHSTQKANDALVRPVGPKSPPNAGNSVVYKQWTKNKGDASADNLNLKISTFFPVDWEEEKIMAAVLLKDEEDMNHRVEASFALESNAGTVYPESDLTDPP